MLKRASRCETPLGLLVFQGLPELALRELKMRGIQHGKHRTVPLRNHELILTSVDAASLPAVAKLRTVEDIFHVPVAGVPVRNRNDLKALSRQWQPAMLQEALAVKNAAFARSRRGRATYWVFVKADRDRQVKRKEIAQQLARVPATFSRWKAADPAEVEVWGFHSGEKLTVGVRLTDNTFRHRRELQRQRKGALRPTIAAAMVVAGRPRADDIVLDPMCGTGTLLFERLGAAPVAKLIGLDIDPEAVRLARANLPPDDGTEVRLGDATALDLPPDSVDTILCNLPFGRAYSDKTANRPLYAKLRQAFDRVLRPAGRMVLLTNDMESLSRAFSGGGRRIERLARVNVLGVWATILRCRPASGR